MTPNQPYLLRAIHEWILDNDMTPHILVDATQSGVEVPQQSVQNGQIVLNISTQAVTALLLDNDAVSFSARFSGIVESLYIPTAAIKAIYASENGQGLVFPEPTPLEEELVKNENSASSQLKIIDDALIDDTLIDDTLIEEAFTENPFTQEKITDDSVDENKVIAPDDKSSKPKKKPPFLKIIK